MPELDDEIVERVARWCAEAGRRAGSAEIRAALGTLGWDELLAARALLAAPPPARPLGPFALADLARGAPVAAAAERERAGRYRPERDEATTSGGKRPSSPPPPRAHRRGKARARANVVVRRAADRLPAPEPAPAAARPALADLFRPEGRTALERLFRRLGGRRAAILAELAATHAAPEGVGDRELDSLLVFHGLSTAFTHRERDELLHALRAAGGFLERAAARIGVDRPALEAALARLGASAEAERIREERRADLRHRSTLTDRATALLGDAARLRDLGLLAEFEADLAARLPEHVRALRAAGEASVEGLARSLSLGPGQAAQLSARFHLATARSPARGPAPRPRGVGPPGSRPSGSPPPGLGRRDRPAPRGGRPGPGGTPRRRPTGGEGRPAGPRGGKPRPAPGSRPRRGR